MKPEEVDLFLSQKDEIIPSSGFVASVMDAVHREAVTPPPIPFPWRRALPGAVALVAALIVLVVFGIQSVSSTDPTPIALPSSEMIRACGWLAMSLVTAWVSFKLAMRLAR